MQIKLIGMFLLALSAGCATIITGSGPSQTVRIASEPRGASVYADGNMIGKTPVVAVLTRKDDHAIKLVMTGYPDHTVQISNTYNGWFWGNILFGGLDGMVIDLLDGSCTGCLSPNDLDMDLSQKASDEPVARVTSRQNPYMHGYAPAIIQSDEPAPQQ